MPNSLSKTGSLLLAALTAAVVMASASSASAATVGIDSENNVVTLDAKPGETNKVKISGFTNPPIGTLIEFKDTSAQLAISTGANAYCVYDTPQIVRCGIPNRVFGIEAYLGDGNDRFELAPNVASGTDDLRASAYGSTGNDTLIGAANDDELDGGGDDDTIIGEDGEDVLSGEDGADLIFGGNGSNDVSGGAGNDVLRAGSDSLFGGSFVEAGPGDDLIVGSNGSDTLWGDGGNDTIDGHLGNDWLRGDLGSDKLNGDEGDDQLTDNTGEADTFHCGADSDKAEADDSDVLDANDCETVETTATPVVVPPVVVRKPVTKPVVKPVKSAIDAKYRPVVAGKLQLNKQRSVLMVPFKQTGLLEQCTTTANITVVARPRGKRRGRAAGLTRAVNLGQTPRDKTVSKLIGVKLPKKLQASIKRGSVTVEANVSTVLDCGLKYEQLQTHELARLIVKPSPKK